MMKAVILSGGSGVRLAPLTNTITKQLIPVANRPTLFHILELIKNETPIKSVCVVVSEDFGHQVKDTLLSSTYAKDFDLSFVFQDKPLGLAHAVQITNMHIGDFPFLMFLGDIIINQGELKLAYEKFTKSNSEALVFLNEVDDPRPYGIAEVEDDKVIKLVEKPQDPKSNLCLSGAYFFKPSIFYAIANIKPSYRGELEITDAVDYLIQNNKSVKYHIVKTGWFDVGTPENMLEANKFLLNQIKAKNKSKTNGSVKLTGNVIIEDGSIIENSEILGPVIIDKNCIIKDSKIGPNVSIGSNVSIENTNIEESIILCESKILNLNSTLSKSLIGRNSSLHFSSKLGVQAGTKIQYIIGDNTKCTSL